MMRNIIYLSLFGVISFVFNSSFSFALTEESAKESIINKVEQVSEYLKIGDIKQALDSSLLGYYMSFIKDEEFKNKYIEIGDDLHSKISDLYDKVRYFEDKLKNLYDPNRDADLSSCYNYEDFYESYTENLNNILKIYDDMEEKYNSLSSEYKESAKLYLRKNGFSSFSFNNGLTYESREKINSRISIYNERKNKCIIESNEKQRKLNEDKERWYKEFRKYREDFYKYYNAGQYLEAVYSYEGIMGYLYLDEVFSESELKDMEEIYNVAKNYVAMGINKSENAKDAGVKYFTFSNDEVQKAKKELGNKAIILESLVPIIEEKDEAVVKNVQNLLDGFTKSKDSYTRSVGIYFGYLISYLD